MTDVVFLYGLCTAVIAKYAGLYWLSRKPKKLIRVGKVSRLFVYPIKSCRGIAVESAKVGHHGFEVEGVKDRHWLIVSASNVKNAMWCSKKPKMVLITPSIHDNRLHLDAEGMETLKLPIQPEFDPAKVIDTRVVFADAQGLDCGEEAAEWLTKFLGKPYRLLSHSPDIPKVKIQGENNEFKHLGQEGEESCFHNLTPYMLSTEESLVAVNERLSQPVKMENFRPNIVVSGVPTAFEEEEWSAPITIAGSNFRTVRCCTRCPNITVDPALGTANKNLEPLRTMNSIFKKEGEHAARFGIQLAVKHCSGNIKVGDDVFAVIHRD